MVVPLTRILQGSRMNVFIEPWGPTNRNRSDPVFSINPLWSFPPPRSIAAICHSLFKYYLKVQSDPAIDDTSASSSVDHEQERKLQCVGGRGRTFVASSIEKGPPYPILRLKSIKKKVNTSRIYDSVEDRKPACWDLSSALRIVSRFSKLGDMKWKLKGNWLKELSWGRCLSGWMGLPELVVGLVPQGPDPAL